MRRKFRVNALWSQKPVPSASAAEKKVGQAFAEQRGLLIEGAPLHERLVHREITTGAILDEEDDVRQIVEESLQRQNQRGAAQVEMCEQSGARGGSGRGGRHGVSDSRRG